MSDTPQGGWWKASDGKWYPPETHPDYRPIGDRVAEVGGPAAEGWWRANDGNWYPPDAAPSPEPDRSEASAGAEIDLTVQREPDSVDVLSDPVSGVSPVPTSEVPPPIPEGASSSQLATSDVPLTSPLAGSRRGMFDLEPPDESAQPGTPLAPSRPMFGSSASTSASPEAGPATTPLPGMPPVPGSAPSRPSAAGPAPATPASSGSVDTHGPTSIPIGPQPDVPPEDEPAETAPMLPPAETSTGSDESAPAAGSRKWLLVGGGVALVLLVGLLAALVLGGGGDESAETPSSSSTTTTDAPSTSTTAAPSTTIAPPSSTLPGSEAPAPPAPVELPAQVTGVGSATIDIGRESTDRLLALVTHDGPGAVSVELLDADGGAVQTLVGSGVSGQYLGVLPVNFAAGASFRSVRFTGEGPWAVTFVLPASAPRWIPEAGPFESEGDRVVLVEAAEPLRLVADCPECVGGLQVRPWSDSSASTPSPLRTSEGVITVPSGTTALQITATGPDSILPAWSLREE